MRITIRYKFPSLNDYIRACRGNRFGGAAMKRNVQSDISFYIAKMPRFEKPVTIDFTWIEKNKRRDYDNVAFAKKFILDAMVEQGKLPDDNRKFVKGFSDHFRDGTDYYCILDIKEVEL